MCELTLQMILLFIVLKCF